MNIVVQCCGLALMMVIICFFLSQNKLQLKTTKAFIGIWLVTLFSLLLDIQSMVLIYFRNVLSEFLVKFGCKLYIASLIWIAIFCVIYLCADIFEDKKQFIKYCKYFAISGLAINILLFCIPIYIYDEGPYDTYTYGPATILTYIVAFLVLCLIAFLNVTHKSHINPNRRRAVWLWMTVWLAAALIQFLNHSLLLVGFASAVGIVIIYLKLENPESYLDRETGLFNEAGFILYIKELINQNEEYYILCFDYEIDVRENLMSEMEIGINMEIGQFLRRIQNTLVFRLSDGKMVLTFLSRDDMEDAYQLLRIRFVHTWGTNQPRLIKPRWYYLTEPCLMERAEDYLALFRYAALADKDCLEIDSMIVQEFYGEQQVEKMLIQAMHEDRVEVFYQPIYSTRKQRFVSAEALVRIRSEEGRIIPPSVFVEVAERTGLIIRLGEIVFRKVCGFIKEHDVERLNLEFIDVNLSMVQCGNEQMAGSFIKIMKETGVPSSSINLEITETASLSERRILLQNMQQLREFGVKFSLDDFGTGQSNLNYIVDMPVDIVKFDQKMIQSYFANQKARYVMDATMHMIHGLQLNIVAEGVETEEQFTTLASLGIGFIQGYYFSKPLPKEDFVRFLESQAEA